MANSLSLVEMHPGVWRGSQAQMKQSRLLPTGFTHFDSALSGGFPASGVIRIVCLPGCGELSFLKSVFNSLQAETLAMFINAPGMLTAPWLNRTGLNPSDCKLVTAPDDLSGWATEEAIKSDACSIVCCWTKSILPGQARRLQVAAAQHECMVVLFEHPVNVQHPLPIALDLLFMPATEGFEVNINKQLKGWPVRGVKERFKYTPDNSAIASAMSRFNRLPEQDGARHG
ncbi:MAG: hypothetical protein CL587_08145 [Alteromonadaceae bacterium]|nr:hypothetical protein [Alteromonadaceae bacterium]